MWQTNLNICLQEFLGATTPGTDSYNYSPEIIDEGEAEGDYDPEGEEEYEEYPEQGNSAGIGASASAI